jgi:hypothetical protein
MFGMKTKCENCGAEFETRRRVHRFCTAECRYEYWIKTHPRVVIGQGFRIVPDEPGGNRMPTKERA